MYQVVIIDSGKHEVLGSFASAAEAYHGLEGAAACTRHFDLAIFRQSDGQLIVYMKGTGAGIAV